MNVVRFHTPKGISECSFDAPIRVAELLQTHTHPVEQPCAGQGKCGKCQVHITGALSAPDETERRVLTEHELQQGIRLACRAIAEGDVEVWLKESTEEDIITHFMLPDLPVTTDAEGVGLAIDIGTTTLAAYLYDLHTHELLAVRSMPNPQRAFGADVTSRLKAALEGQGEQLRQAITEAIREMVVSALTEANCREAALHSAVITGNTAMLYLLMGQEPSSIAFVPFEPVTRMGIHVPGDTVGLFPHTRVWLPECISAYVGADVTCALLYAASRPEYRHKPVLMADIGTNGEMVLATETKLYTCSTAAGPAFEGAGIRFGMTAREGAIHRVDVTDGELVFKALGNVLAVGICGSGLVDAIAALRQLEIIDETGRIDTAAPGVEMLDGQPAYRFPGSDVLLTQADVRAVQLAKSALCAGMLTLLDVAGLSCEELRVLQLAGGFGSCIRPETAEMIGLIPAGMAKRTVHLGNAAGAGAAMMLLSFDMKQQSGKHIRRQESVELSSSSVFTGRFMDCMMLGSCE